MGRYVGAGVNASTKHPYPSEPLLEKAQKQRDLAKKVMTDQQIANQMKKNFKLYMGIQNKNSKKKK